MLGSLAGRESISKSNGSSVAPRHTPRISCNAAPDRAACPDFLYAGLTGFPVELDGVGGPHAPFRKKRRIEFANATILSRKSGPGVDFVHSEEEGFIHP
jgi:hypothetical protein